MCRGEEEEEEEEEEEGLFKANAVRRIQQPVEVFEDVLKDTTFLYIQEE